MKRLAAVIALSLSVASCVATPPPDEPTLPAETPLPGDAVKDAKAAVEIAKTLCRAEPLKVWLAPYRWDVKLHDGIWRARLASLHGGLKCPYYDVGVRAADGSRAGNCAWCISGPIFIAGAK